MARPTKVKQKLLELLESTDANISIAAATKLADLELLESRNEAKSGPLKEEIRSLRKELEQARQQHEALTLENGKLVARVAELEPFLAKATELDALRSENEQWKQEQTRLLTADAESKLRAAREAEMRAEEKSQQAEAKFAVERLKKSVAAWQKMSTHEMPPFFETPGMSSMFWDSWPAFNETPGKSALWVSLESYTTNVEAFRSFALRVLHAECRWCDKQSVIESIELKREFVHALAEHLGILENLQATNETELQNHAAWHNERQTAAAAALERQRALAGVGRTPIGPSTDGQSSSGLAPELHPPDCCCPVHGGIPARLRSFEIQEKV